jgi:hypothetical protein
VIAEGKFHSSKAAQHIGKTQLGENEGNDRLFTLER